MSSHQQFSRPIEISAIGSTEVVKNIEATNEERSDIAGELGLLEVKALSAEMTLTRDEDGMIHVDGRVTAEIIQACVVSLDPVAETIDEPIALRFVDAHARIPSTGTKAGEVNVDPIQDDPPEILSGPIIDLGEIVLEHFILAIDPYPRAPGVEMPVDMTVDSAEKDESPFAVLGRMGFPKSTER